MSFLSTVLATDLNASITHEQLEESASHLLGMLECDEDEGGGDAFDYDQWAKWVEHLLWRRSQFGDTEFAFDHYFHRLIAAICEERQAQDPMFILFWQDIFEIFWQAGNIWGIPDDGKFLMPDEDGSWFDGEE